MRSEEFFNILDDIDDRIVSEIYEDVQRPQKLVAMPNSPKRLPKLLIGSAACLAVIAAAALTVRFAVPNSLPALSGTSESSYDWFAQPHFQTCQKIDSPNAQNIDIFPYDNEFYFSDFELSPDHYSVVASDDGTVVFSGFISDEYGSGVIIKYTETAYIAYGGLDPDSVTVSAGDTVTEHETFAYPKVPSCLGDNIVIRVKTSRQPISEEFFKTDCKLHCQGTQEKLVNWFAQKHINPWRRTDRPETDDEPYQLDYEHGFYFSGTDWSPENYELIAADNGTVTFAGKISDAYGSGIIIKHAENAYIAYGGLDPDTVTVSAGDTVTTGETLAHPKPFGCMPAYSIAYIKVSGQPITEQVFQSRCDINCRGLEEVKNRLNSEWFGLPDSDGNHHIAANTKEEVKSLTDSTIIYTGTDSDGSGTVVVLDQSAMAFIIYKGLDTTFPDYYLQNDLMKAAEGDTIGYVGDSGDAYWFVLDLLEFEEYSKETGINFYPTSITFKNSGVYKP